jgi:hypothetical protein
VLLALSWPEDFPKAKRKFDCDRELGNEWFGTQHLARSHNDRWRIASTNVVAVTEHCPQAEI